MIHFGINFEKGPMLLACNLKVKYYHCCLMGALAQHSATSSEQEPHTQTSLEQNFLSLIKVTLIHEH